MDKGGRGVPRPHTGHLKVERAMSGVRSEAQRQEARRVKAIGLA